MRLAALLLAVTLHGQSIGGGVSVASSNGMGYDSPAIGGFVRGQWKQLRAIGEVDNSRKWFVGDGLSWRTVATIDSPQIHGLSALAVGGVGQHRNSQWTKTGGWWGGGARYGPLYGWYSPADTSPNRVSRSTVGYEWQRGHLWAQYEITRYWFCCTGGGAGWGAGMRLGWMRSR